jgi:hypothetical protein
MPPKKAAAVKNDSPGMHGQRGRNQDGSLRQKRRDTLVGTIEDQYAVDFNVRRDMKLDTLREKLRATSIDDLIEKNAH